MRILAVTNLYPNPYDPIRATFNRQQFRALAAQHAVRVICPIAWTEELAGRRTGVPALPKDRRATVDGIPVDYPRYWFPPRVLRGRYGHCYRASIRGTFRRAVAEFRPDVVLGTWAYPDGWAAVHLAPRSRSAGRDQGSRMRRPLGAAAEPGPDRSDRRGPSRGRPDRGGEPRLGAKRCRVRSPGGPDRSGLQRCGL